MLGLIDEYCPAGDPQIADTYPHFERDCEKYSVIFPRFGVRGTSLMSWGYHVYPCHYVPLAKALDTLIGDYASTMYRARHLDLASCNHFLEGLAVSIDPLPMKAHVEENEEVNYLDWLRQRPDEDKGP
jgi:hypothetical protein